MEHEGPGKYDYEYMDYVVEVLRRCKEYGFWVYMDPHQDVFSRYTGGSGAPYWVIPACGIDHRGFSPTQAAFLHNEWPSPQQPDPAAFPDMMWATGYTRLAPASLSVLFFAGHEYAPRCKIDGKHISEWLQDHFLAACRELALKIEAAGDLYDECVIGWDSLNEPNPTYVGLEDLATVPEKWTLRQGPCPSPLQSMILGVGKAQTVQNWVFSSLGPKKAGEVEVDPNGASVWLSAEDDERIGGSKWGWERDPDWPLGECVWAAHGVWDPQTNKVLRPDYFNGSSTGRKTDFIADHWLPFWRKYQATIRPIHKEAIMFLQPPVFEPPPHELTSKDLQGRACLSCHFYDGLTLITKHWNWFNADAVGLLRGKYSALVFALRFGSKAVRKVIRDQIGYLREDTLSILGQYPTLVGEIGVPFDLDNKRSYYGDAKGKGKADYTAQTAALDASLNGCDGTNVLSYTMWTYCPDNTHQWGDGWNGEDLSIWSLDDIKGSLIGSSTNGASKLASSSSSSLEELFSGTRSAAAFSRPYPVATNGTPLTIDFAIKSSTFTYKFEVTHEDWVERQEDAGESSQVETDKKARVVTRSADDQSRGLSTEIFLPMVHYAADDQLSQRIGRAEVPAPDSDASQDVQGRHQLSTTSSRTALGFSTSLAVVQDPKSLLTSSSLPPLSLDVTLSSGEYSVQGQILTWHLPKESFPTLPGEKIVHTIVVKRKGGAIHPVQGRSVRSNDDDGGWLERCLGCTIM